MPNVDLWQLFSCISEHTETHMCIHLYTPHTHKTKPKIDTLASHPVAWTVVVTMYDIILPCVSSTNIP